MPAITSLVMCSGAMAYKTSTLNQAAVTSVNSPPLTDSAVTLCCRTSCVRVCEAASANHAGQPPQHGERRLQGPHQRFTLLAPVALLLPCSCVTSPPLILRRYTLWFAPALLLCNCFIRSLPTAYIGFAPALLLFDFSRSSLPTGHIAVCSCCVCL